MVVYSIYVVSRSGGLIYQCDQNYPKIEVEKTFSFPLDMVVRFENQRTIVAFGQKDGINVGHMLTAINGDQVNGKTLEDGRDVFDVLSNEDNFPINLKFCRPRLNINEKIFMASMFYPLFALSAQLSPETNSSGIELVETDVFKLHCFQTLTGIKIIAVTDRNQIGTDILLRRIYELYADFALKNPFYSLEMPIRCELFETNLSALLEQVEKVGVSNV